MRPVPEIDGCGCHVMKLLNCLLCSIHLVSEARQPCGVSQLKNARSMCYNTDDIRGR